MSSTWTTQPGKALWVLYFFATFPTQLVINSIAYIFPFLRPHTKWTYSQALGNFVFAAYWRFICTIEFHVSREILPGSEGERFITIAPGKDSVYRDVVDDANIRPVPIGAMWYPTLYSSNRDKGKKIVLHFHGGAFVAGGVRPINVGWGPETLAKSLGGFALMPQYRMAWQEQGRFPAALQDAISAYAYLISLGVDPKDVIFSGDSAGGNIATVLLRYVTDHPKVLPSPGGACLWSPWVNPAADPHTLLLKPSYKTDYIPLSMPLWGCRDYLPRHLPATHPLVSPLGNEFVTKVPIFLQTGEVEVLYDEDVAFAKAMEKKGNKVKLYVIKNAMHDVFAAAPILGFKKQASVAAAMAAEFINA